jgi:hypothetical protein
MLMYGARYGISIGVGFGPEKARKAVIAIGSPPGSKLPGFQRSGSAVTKSVPRR